MLSRVGAMVKRADPDGGTTEVEAQHGDTGKKVVERGTGRRYRRKAVDRSVLGKHDESA